MARKSLRENEEAVSSIIGELMVLAITVAIFGLLVVAVNALMARPQADVIDVSASTDGSTISLVHMGGDSVSYGYVTVIVNGNTVPFSVAAADANGNGLWDIGETLGVPDPAGEDLDVIVYDSSSSAVLGSFTLR